MGNTLGFILPHYSLLFINFFDSF
ncbi:hypothetical protein CY0110_18222 [Crocosphaera chwakensis CCY0110]|uniref:Uncharacterized protein n=1 Tax=Crocosphaera chwakensis CCY0110 TaxID=391612 RepID=A3IIX6_9CHRO|nr:hypothetical protein CY0110_18222 [Crocosphaera chwakensis CCY0110]